MRRCAAALRCGGALRHCVAAEVERGYASGAFMVVVEKVKSGSPAERAGILPGDELVSVNGSPINDGLDYDFYTADSALDIELARGTLRVQKGEYEPLGLEFGSFLITPKKRCRNNCVFCFIDQNPRGMRESVYFKDDDYRLSFLHGTYVTLTNLCDADVARITEMRLSPVNVSVHAMNGELRRKMMRNPKAAESLKYLTELSEHGIAINAQLVICEGINDGAELQYSMERLRRLKSLQSVSAVPVGLTRHRQGLFRLAPCTKAGALAVVKAVEAFGARCKAETGSRLFYASDEFYLKAGLPLPDEDFYEDYPQLENGVGMLRCHSVEFEGALEDAKRRFPRGAFAKRRVSLATGVLARGHIERLCAEAERAFPGLRCEVYAVENGFFGSSVTVSGLVTGGDLIRALVGKPHGETLIIPCNMLRWERDLFLDGKSVSDVEQALSVRLSISEKDGADLLHKILGTA